MAAEKSDKEPASPNPNDKIRDAGKWLIGASAAVGAALIAGSQLSHIGALPLCLAWSPTCLRLPISIVGAAVALAGIVYIMWRAVQLLLPIGTTIEELKKNWDAVKGLTQPEQAKKARADVAFFLDNLRLIGAAGPDALISAKSTAWTELTAERQGLETASDKAAAKVLVEAAEAKYERAVDNISRVLEVASYQLLMAKFRGLLIQLVLATVVVAVGIVAFAWASNPGPASANLAGAKLTSADLRGVDLSGATLDGADLTGADLSGADLGGASVKAVIWHNTICPDATKSADRSPETCIGHLTP